MASCTDKSIANLLHAYELGLLSDEDRLRVEKHVLECDSCFRDLERMADAARLLKFDPEARRGVELATRPPDHQPSKSLAGRRFLRTGMPIAITAALVMLLVLKDWQVDIRPSDSALATANRVAILPFDDYSPAGKDNQVGRIISDLVITDLSQATSVQVVSSQYLFDLSERTTGLTGQRPPREPRVIAQNAGARWLVTGTVSQVSPNFVVTAQLVDVSTGTVKVGTTIHAAPGASVFAVADSLSTDVLAALSEPATTEGRPVSELTTESPQAYHEYMLGVDSYRRFYYREAEQYFRQALAFDTLFAMPYYYLSMVGPVAERQTMLDVAVKLLGRAGDREQYLIRSLAARAAGNLKEAIEILTAFVNRYPDEKEPLFQLGAAEYGLGMLPKVVHHLQAAIMLDSSYSEAFNQIAYAYNWLGDTASAFRAVERYVALEPGDANPYDSRGYLYAVNGHIEKAIESYREALGVRPNYASSLLSLGVMYGFQQNFHLAESCLVTLSHFPEPQTRSSARLYRACLAAYRGQFHRAVLVFDSAMHADSADGYTDGIPAKLYAKAIVLEASGRLSDALEVMQECRSLRRRRDRADVNGESAYYARLLARDGRIDEARALVEQLKAVADSMNMQPGSYWMAMSSIAAVSTGPDSAIIWIDRATSMTTMAFHDRLRQATAYLEAQRLAEAVSALEKLRDFYVTGRMFWAPEGAKVHYYLGRAYEESHWYAQASGEYRTFLAIWRDADPGITEVADAQARLKHLNTLHD